MRDADLAPGPWRVCVFGAQVIRMVGESQETVGAGVGGAQSAGSNKLPTLSEYGTNLTQQAAEVREGSRHKGPARSPCCFWGGC